MIKKMDYKKSIIGMLLLVNAALGAGEFAVTDYSEFYMTPRSEAAIHLKTADTPGTAVNYCIRDYVGNIIRRGTAEIAADGMLTIKLDLPRGFYELILGDNQSLIRLFAAPRFERPADPFFGIDAGFSWFPGGVKEFAMMQAHKDHGIAFVRERLSYIELQEGLDKSGGDWRVGNPERYLGVRSRLKSHGLNVTDCFHDAPASTGAKPHAWSSADYPKDYLLVAGHWSNLLSRLSSVIDELEIWNEPDGFSAGPATYYPPLVKTIAWVNFEGKYNKRLIGGVFSELASPEFYKSCGDNGLYDVVDAVSFHTYSGPAETEKQIRTYRDLFARFGRESLPLYITEAGRPFSNESPSEQARSAAYIAAKAVVGRACGLAQYYPFFAQSYGEGQMNFSMLDSNSAPRRQLAGYYNTAITLADAEYVGNLKAQGAPGLVVPVFDNGKDYIAVPVSLAIDPAAVIVIAAPASEVRGLDGRSLDFSSAGIPLPDGIGFVILDRAKVQADFSGYIDVKTPYMELYRRAHLPLPPKKMSPVVLSFQPDPQQFVCDFKRTKGFFVTDQAQNALRYQVNVFNVGNEPQTIRLVLDSPNNVRVSGLSSSEIALAPKSMQKVSFTVDIAGALQTDKSVTLPLRALDANGKTLDTVAPVFGVDAVEKSYRALSRGERITVDGRIDPAEWGRSEVIHLTGEDGNECDARFAWSPAGLNFAIAVKEKEHIQTANPDLAWQQDCIQLAVDTLQHRKMDGTQYEFGLSLKDGESRWSRWIAPAGMPAISPQSKLCVIRDEQNKLTVYEGNLAWEDLKPATGEVNRKIGLTFCVQSLNSANNKSVMEWTPGITSAGGKDPSLFGEIMLYDSAE